MSDQTPAGGHDPRTVLRSGADREAATVPPAGPQNAHKATAEDAQQEWFEGGDGHGYRYQYIGPVHYLCECGAYFLNRERWLAHKSESENVIPPAQGGVHRG